MKKKISISCLSLLAIVFAALLFQNYRSQEKQMFQSVPLPKDHVYHWDSPFDELYIPVGEKSLINALHFHCASPKGVVLFLHGRGKNLDHYGKYAKFFLEYGYEVFIVDYRGFGKSSPGFKEEWFLEDSLAAYNYLRKHYPEDKIIVYGQSLGTAMATYVASKSAPHLLILEAPFYNMLDAAASTKPYIPRIFIALILKYSFKTNVWMQNVTSPVCIFHGTKDDIIPFSHSERLYHDLKRDDKEVDLVVLPEWGHTQIASHQLYKSKLSALLQ